jgi:predicted Zn-dependent peptidase
VAAVDRSRLPAPGTVRPFVFPSIEKSVLASGLTVWSVRHAVVPVASFVLLVRSGSSSDPDGMEGLASITADMLDEGSGELSAIGMHEALARIGAQFDTDIGADAALVGVTTLSKFAERGLRLLADIVARPSLTGDDFARVRQLRLHRLTQLRDVPGAVADRTFMRLLYGPHPYGHTPMGTEQSVATLTVDDVRRFHAAGIRPDTATLIAVGDLQHADVERLAADAFAGWERLPAGAAVSDDRHLTPPSSGARLVVVPRPGAPQSELRIGHIAAARDTPDYHALVTANMVLGGQFVSRINLNLREDKGLTYGARTSFDFRKLPGPFALQVSVQTAATSRAIEESLGEIAAIRGSRPVTDDELALSVAALTRGYARNFETGEQIARAVTQLALYGLPDDYFVQFVPRIESLTRSEVMRAAADHLHPEQLHTLVVGDLDVIGKDLGQLGLGDPVVLSADSL